MSDLATALKEALAALEREQERAHTLAEQMSGDDGRYWEGYYLGTADAVQVLRELLDRPKGYAESEAVESEEPTDLLQLP